MCLIATCLFHAYCIYVEDISSLTFSSEVMLISSPNVLKIMIPDCSDASTQTMEQNCNCQCDVFSHKLDIVMSAIDELKSMIKANTKHVSVQHTQNLMHTVVLVIIHALHRMECFVTVFIILSVKSVESRSCPLHWDRIALQQGEDTMSNNTKGSLPCKCIHSKHNTSAYMYISH